MSIRDDDEAGGVSPIVAEALAFQKLSSDAYFNQREREENDLEFQVPENQWDVNAKAIRAGQNFNGVPTPPRPMLSIPILDAPIQQQLNSEKNAHLGVQVHPLSEDATDDTAEVLQGLYRHIEVESRAGLARSWAFDRAVKAGWGCYRADVVYDETTDDPRDLTIRINRILHQSSVFLDPFAQQPDWSDGKRALVVSYVPNDQYKREWPKSALASYGDDELSQLATDYPFWLNSTGESKAVCVAEYFYTEYRKRQWVILDDGAFAFADEIPAGRTVAQQNIREIDWPEVYWCKLNGVEVLEGPQKWNGRFIPIIPVIGKELQPFRGTRVWTGMIGPNRDAARLVNYEVSNAVEKDALSPKAPYIGAVGQFKTMRKQWDQANVRNFSTLEYDPVAAGGELAPPPARNMVSADLSSALQLVDLARGLVQAGTSTTDASMLENLAKKRVAKDTIAGLASQGEIGNSNYITNLAEISMPYEAKVVMDLIPTLFDRPGRVAQVLGMDNERKTVMLNQPFTMDKATKRPVAYQQPQTAQPGMIRRIAGALGMGPQPSPIPSMDAGGNNGPQVKHYDLSKGKYGFVVEIGKSYKTRMQQGSDAFGEVMTSVPELVPILGDIWMQFQDFPGHNEAARRLKALLPPQVKAADEQDDTPEALQAKLAQATQMVEQLTQQAQEQAKIIETEQVKASASMAETDADNATKLEIAKINAQRDVELARVGLARDLALERLKASTAIETREDEQRHEMALAGAQAVQDAEQAERQAEHDAAMAERAADEGLIAAEQGHQHAMEQQEQRPEATP